MLWFCVAFLLKVTQIVTADIPSITTDAAVRLGPSISTLKSSSDFSTSTNVLAANCNESFLIEFQHSKYSYKFNIDVPEYYTFTKLQPIVLTNFLFLPGTNCNFSVVLEQEHEDLFVIEDDDLQNLKLYNSRKLLAPFYAQINLTAVINANLSISTTIIVQVEKFSFSKTLYTAELVEHLVFVLDGPIAFDLPTDLAVTFRIITDNNASYTIEIGNFTLNLRLNQMRNYLFNEVIQIGAFGVDGECLGETSVILVKPFDDLDDNIIIVDETQFVIVSYSNCSLYLVCIILIGVLIIILEIYGIVMKYKKNGLSYKKLEEYV